MKINSKHISAPVFIFCIVLFAAFIFAPEIPAQDKQDETYSGLFSGRAAFYFFLLLSLGMTVLSALLLMLFIKNRRTMKFCKREAAGFSAIYKSLPDLFFCKDTNLRYTNCNHAYEKMSGRSEDEILGKTAIELYSHLGKIAEEFFETDKTVIKTGQKVVLEQWLNYADGSRRFCETKKIPLINNGKIAGLIGITRDITKYKKAEISAIEAYRAKTNFLARMSHEIRTPMNAIVGMTELALRENDVPSIHRHIFTVKQASTHLLAIINDILDFSKSETGKLEILSERYSFLSLINDVVSMARMRILDSYVRFTVNVDSTIPNELIGDETRLRQVLLNILDNAVKYTEEGYISFIVSQETINADTINLVMEVTDSGRGIREDDIGNLFEEYFRTDTKRNKDIEGTGLGLPIAWNIIKTMEGDIKVRSEYEKGSTFKIIVPQKIYSNKIIAQVHNSKEKNVLVYERRKIYANSISLTLDNLGVKCSFVENDSELHEKMLSASFSFIFISYILFEKNKAAISQSGANSKIVILARFGEAVSDEKLNILAMPVYSVSVANILNGIYDNFNYGESKNGIAKFSSPSARVLVVDDIKTNLKVAEGLLLPYKMQVDLCSNGMDAINAVLSKHYDLVFMDHKMPDMDGIEAVKRIREMGKCYEVLPIIALTANAISGSREVFLRNGFNDFISKPIDITKLNTILGKYLPKEKQKLSANGSDTEMEHRQVEGIKIEGINTARGIFLSGGNLNIYLEALALFCSDAGEKTYELKQCLETKNIRLYTTFVHGLKSALMNIGAEDLAEKAGILEDAGETGNIDSIKSMTDDFIESLKSLSDKICSLLSYASEQIPDPGTVGSIEFLIPGLEALKMYIQNLDAGKTNLTIDKLKVTAGKGKAGDALQEISNKILLGEYAEAVKKTESLIEEHKAN